jgi:predicted ATPase
MPGDEPSSDRQTWKRSVTSREDWSSWKTLPDNPEHARRELTLLIALGVPLRAIKGFAAPEVGKAYARALELCQREEETAQIVPVLRGLWEFHELRAEYWTARDLGEQLLALAERAQDPAALLVAHDVMGDTMLWLGEFAAARSHLEQGAALYDVQQRQSLPTGVRARS